MNKWLHIKGTVKMIRKHYLYYLIGGFVVSLMLLMWTNMNNTTIYSVQYDSTHNSLVQPSNQFGHHSNMINASLKYILIWTSPKTEPLRFLREGQEVFKKKKCAVTDCYVTANRKIFGSVTEYDVLLFHGPEIYNKRNPDLPAARSPHQLFVFASMESADYYPLCSNNFDNYFNLTWTYKLNSDVFYGYMIIRNKTSDVIGPNEVMHWENIDAMIPIDEEIKDKLKYKSIAAAWFVSNCNAPSGRDNFVKQVQRELDRYKLVIDIYGNCGTKKCPRGSMTDCLHKIESDYYFYFSFENSFSDDYVTEKLLHALHHYAVPVVYGTANYTRFMPDGIYLNALELGAEELAKQMAEIISDKEKYYNFFKWHNHYSYHDIEESAEADPYCKFCEKINKHDVKSTHVYDNLKDWLNPKKLRRYVCGFSFW